jgi:hypothetical protein
MEELTVLIVQSVERRNVWLALQALAEWLHASRELVPSMSLRVDDTHRRARRGTHRRSQLGLQVKCSRNESNHCSRTFPPLRFDHELVSRVGMQVESGEAIAHIRGIGRRWDSWWVFSLDARP